MPSFDNMRRLSTLSGTNDDPKGTGQRPVATPATRNDAGAATRTVVNSAWDHEYDVAANILVQSTGMATVVQETSFGTASPMAGKFAFSQRLQVHLPHCPAPHPLYAHPLDANGVQRHRTTCGRPHSVMQGGRAAVRLALRRLYTDRSAHSAPDLDVAAAVE